MRGQSRESSVCLAFAVHHLGLALACSFHRGSPHLHISTKATFMYSLGTFHTPSIFAMWTPGMQAPSKPVKSTQKVHGSREELK